MMNRMRRPQMPAVHQPVTPVVGEIARQNGRCHGGVTAETGSRLGPDEPKSETADDAVDGGEDDAHQRAGQHPIDEMQRQVDARLADQPGRPGQGRAAFGERR